MNKEEKKKIDFKKLAIDLKKGFLVGIKDKKRWLVCLIEILIAGVLIAIDLITKEFIYGHCKENGRINIIEGVICFTSVENTGAGFGIFSNDTLALTIISIICSVFLTIFIFYSYPRRNLWLRSALIMILGGAIGNIVDRIALGYVRDFIYFELIDFAVFNFADSCLTVGTIVLIIYIIFFYGKEEKEKEKKKQEEEMLAMQSVEQSTENITLEEQVEISTLDDKESE